MYDNFEAAVHASDRSGLQCYDVGFRVEGLASWLSANNIEADEWMRGRQRGDLMTI